MNEGKKPLLVITLADETSAPEVLYKGEKVKWLINASVSVNAGAPDGEFMYAIESLEKINERIVTKRIESKTSL